MLTVALPLTKPFPQLASFTVKSVKVVVAVGFTVKVNGFVNMLVIVFVTAPSWYVISQGAKPVKLMVKFALLPVQMVCVPEILAVDCVMILTVAVPLTLDEQTEPPSLTLFKV